MKGEPIEGRRYVLKKPSQCLLDGETEFRGVARKHETPENGVYWSLDYKDCKCGGVNVGPVEVEYLTPLVPKKTPPKPPEGWVYASYSNKVIKKAHIEYVASREDGKLIPVGIFTLEDFQQAAKHFKRYKQWESRLHWRKDDGK